MGKKGNVDCEHEGFDRRMREASFGADYTVTAGLIHDGGERWSFGELVAFSFGGLVEWYCRQLGTDLRTVAAIPEVAVLGAFFHRFKVVDEWFWAVDSVLERGVSALLPPSLPESKRDRFLQRVRALPDFATVETTLASLGEFQALRMPINVALDRSQCLLYTICKHEALPDGFQMDPRIERWAHSPIQIDFVQKGETLRPLGRDDLVSGIPDARVAALAGWITLFREVGAAFAPEVTFGVF